MSFAESKLFSWRAAFTAPNSPMPKTMRHVMLQLSLHMDEYGESCYPTIKELMARTCLSNRSVIDQIKGAQAAGWLSVEEHGFRGQKWRNHQYRPLIPDGFVPMRWRDWVAENDLKDEIEADDPLSESYPQEAETELYKNRPGGEGGSPAPAKGGEGGSPRQTEGGEPNDVKVVNEVHSSSSIPHYKKKEMVDSDIGETDSDPPPVDNSGLRDYVRKVERWLVTEFGLEKDALDSQHNYAALIRWRKQGVTRIHLKPMIASAKKLHVDPTANYRKLIDYLDGCVVSLNLPLPEPPKKSRRELKKCPAVNAARTESLAQIAATGLILSEATK